MLKLNYVGVDVSARSLSAARMGVSGHLLHRDFSNDAPGHARLITWATGRGRRARFCIEATGLYSLPLALALHAHEQTEVMMVNPRAIKSFALARMQRAKTDRADADLIRIYGEQMAFTAWKPPSKKALQLQALMRRVHQIKVMLNQEKNRAHAYSYRSDDSDGTTMSIQDHCVYLQSMIDALESEGLALIQSTAVLRRPFERLLTIKGVAQLSAMRIIAEVFVMPSNLRPEQWVAQAGLDPRTRESGSSVDKPRFISRMGNKHLRYALYMPALVATKFNPPVCAFYQKLIAAGKKKKQALVAVMRKLLRSIWGMIQYDQDFENDKFYVMP
jgi:transposase